MNDHGQNDPLPFDLTGWQPVADRLRKDLEEMFGRKLTEIPEPPMT